MAPLLMHSDHVPASARHALRAASYAPAHANREALINAAKILHAETGLPCEDVLELVGLPDDAAGCKCG